MAEIQQNTASGETAARFIEFVMMQAQNASLFLGLIPNPSSGKPEVNLELARLFIDQLSMIQEKTRGNLSTEETGVLRNALTHLQMAFVEVSQGGRPGDLSDAEENFPATAPLEEAADVAHAPESTATATENTLAADDQRESKKRFSKSYGG